MSIPASDETARSSDGPSSVGRRIFNLLGWAAVVASVVFLLNRIRVNELWTLDTLRPGAATVVCLLGAVAYAGLCLLLSTSWWFWLRWAGEQSVSLSTCHGLYGRTQIAKYLPGNVFHFAGRHIAGRRAGISHTALVAAAVLETMSLVSASIVVAGAGMGWVAVDRVAEHLPTWMGPVVIAVLMILPICAVLATHRLRRCPTVDEQTGRFTYRVGRVAAPYLLNLIFMTAAGVLLIPTISLGVDNAGDAPPLLLIGVFALAWLIGFVTPGASGGLGVREAVIVLVLSPYTGDAQAVLAALMMRMITLGGDLAFFAVALRIRPAQEALSASPSV